MRRFGKSLIFLFIPMRGITVPLFSKIFFSLGSAQLESGDSGDYFDWYDADCDSALTENSYLCHTVGRVSSIYGDWRDCGRVFRVFKQPWCKLGGFFSNIYASPEISDTLCRCLNFEKVPENNIFGSIFWEGSEKNTDGLKSEQPHISRSIWIRYFWASFWKFSLSASGAVTYLSSDGYAPVLQVREAVTYLSRRAGARDFLYFPFSILGWTRNYFPSCFCNFTILGRAATYYSSLILGWTRMFYSSRFWVGHPNVIFFKISGWTRKLKNGDGFRGESSAAWDE